MNNMSRMIEFLKHIRMVIRRRWNKLLQILDFQHRTLGRQNTALLLFLSTSSTASDPGQQDPSQPFAGHHSSHLELTISKTSPSFPALRESQTFLFPYSLTTTVAENNMKTVSQTFFFIRITSKLHQCCCASSNNIFTAPLYHASRLSPLQTIFTSQQFTSVPWLTSWLLSFFFEFDPFFKNLLAPQTALP